MVSGAGGGSSPPHLQSSSHCPPSMCSSRGAGRRSIHARQHLPSVHSSSDQWQHVEGCQVGISDGANKRIPAHGPRPGCLWSACVCNDTPDTVKGGLCSPDARALFLRGLQASGPATSTNEHFEDGENGITPSKLSQAGGLMMNLPKSVASSPLAVALGSRTPRPANSQRWGWMARPSAPDSAGAKVAGACLTDHLSDRCILCTAATSRLAWNCDVSRPSFPAGCTTSLRFAFQAASWKAVTVVTSINSANTVSTLSP